MKTKILELLKNSNDYLSGQDLCETFGVSRTAVWKVIKQLKEEGYEISSVNHKGYKILSCPDILSESEIRSSLSLHDANFLNQIIYLDTVDSTNTYAKKLGEQGASDWTLVVADKQTGGKGRRGRSFDSPENVGIFMTLLFRPDISPNKASMLTLISGLAVCRGLSEVCHVHAGIKWPNDIVAGGKKLCGILTEMSAEMEGIHYVVTGIGINVNNKAFSKELENTATSVYLETGQIFQRSTIISYVMKYFQKYYNIFLKTKNLSLLKEEYNRYLINKDREVLIIRGDEQYTAVAKYIDEEGELIIERDGKLSAVISGEVSVRGIYGYV